jgi:hypothetical protein
MKACTKEFWQGFSDDGRYRSEGQAREIRSVRSVRSNPRACDSLGGLAQYCSQHDHRIASSSVFAGDLRLVCPRCEMQMELVAKDRGRCPKCGLESVRVGDSA